MILWIGLGILIILGIIYLAVKTALPAPSPPPPVVIPPGGCKCLTDVKARSPSSGPFDQEYQSIEARDNRTFCGFEQDGYRWACKPADCTPACT